MLEDPIKDNDDPRISRRVIVRGKITEYTEFKPVIVCSGGYVFPDVILVDREEGLILQEDVTGKHYMWSTKSPIRLWPVPIWNKINHWPVNEEKDCPLSPYHHHGK